MRKIVIRTEFERYESAIEELMAIGNGEEHWLRSEPRSELWFHQIVCAIKHNTITSSMFEEMDEKPGNWCYTKPHETWHWKLRSCRNHPKWSTKLYEALEKNNEIEANGVTNDQN